MKTNIFLILFSITNLAAAQNLNKGLTAHYTFEGNLNDQTSGKNDLVAAKGKTDYQLVKSGDSATALDGSTQLVSKSNLDNRGYSECAIAMWVKANKTTSTWQICLQGADLGFGAYIQGNTGKFTGFFGKSATAGYHTKSSVTDGKWHHIVTQNDGTTTYMYVDGVLDGTKAQKLLLGSGSTNEKLYMGRSNLNLLGFTGSLNDVRIYDRILNQCEIDLLSGKVLTPIVSYHFDGNLIDSVGKNDLTNSGSASYQIIDGSDQGFNFDGNRQLVSTNPYDNSKHKMVSISLWVKSTTVTSDIQICLQGANTGFGAYIQANTGKFMAFFNKSASSSYVSSQAVTDGKWHHIVAQNDGTTTFMYVDGILDGKKAQTLSVGSGASSEKLYLGKSNLGIMPFTGVLDHVMIFDQMLSLCAIDSLANKNKKAGIEGVLTSGNMDITIYPNPNNGSFTVRTKQPFSKLDITLIDAVGKVLFTENHEGKLSVPVSMEHLATGVYYVRVKYDGSYVTSKIIKE